MSILKQLINASRGGRKYKELSDEEKVVERYRSLTVLAVIILICTVISLAG